MYYAHADTQSWVCAAPTAPLFLARPFWNICGLIATDLRAVFFCNRQVVKRPGAEEIDVYVCVSEFMCIRCEHTRMYVGMYVYMYLSMCVCLYVSEYVCTVYM